MHSVLIEYSHSAQSFSMHTNLWTEMDPCLFHPWHCHTIIVLDHWMKCSRGHLDYPLQSGRKFEHCFYFLNCLSASLVEVEIYDIGKNNRGHWRSQRPGSKCLNSQRIVCVPFLPHLITAKNLNQHLSWTKFIPSYC